jgi:hypothetical protein
VIVDPLEPMTPEELRFYTKAIWDATPRWQIDTFIFFAFHTLIVGAMNLWAVL